MTPKFADGGGDGSCVNGRTGAGTAGSGVGGDQEGTTDVESRQGNTF